VKLQTPKLFKKIVFPSSITYGNKTQGLTIIDEFIYLSQGETAPTISVLNMNGDLLYTYDLNKTDLLEICKDYNPKENATENWSY
ncbi:hypothetical protein, partial [Klebsiella pneumoniae]|uniref:hypothetical protein n=1 Tax=Klebsiella pneumoniae TaxID=573 RepID=UPI00272F89EA